MLHTFVRAQKKSNECARLQCASMSLGLSSLIFAWKILQSFEKTATNSLSLPIPRPSQLATIRRTVWHANSAHTSSLQHVARSPHSLPKLASIIVATTHADARLLAQNTQPGCVLFPSPSPGRTLLLFPFPSPCFFTVFRFEKVFNCSLCLIRAAAAARLVCCTLGQHIFRRRSNKLQVCVGIRAQQQLIRATRIPHKTLRQPRVNCLK